MNAEEAYKITQESDRYGAILEKIKAAAKRGHVEISVTMPSHEVKMRLQNEGGFVIRQEMGRLSIFWDSHRVAMIARARVRAKKQREEVNEEELPEHGTRAWWGRLLRR